MTPLRETIALLKANGWEKVREGKKHMIFYKPGAKRPIPVKRHDFDEDDMRDILKEAGIKK